MGLIERVGNRVASFFRSELEQEHPVEQLKLIGAEVTRQLAAVASKRAGLHTRAALLVAASGVLTSVQSSSWASGWQFISVALSVAAAILGLIILRPRRGDDSNATLYVNERLDADPYSTEYSIVMDNIVVLKGGRKRIEDMAKKLMAGYIVLVAAWASTLMVAALSHAKLI